MIREKGVTMKNILLINAHQRYEGFAEGKLTHSILEQMQNKFISLGFTVKYTNIEEEYDPNEEIEKHLWADLIVFQTPVYWMSVPWITKKYLDTVYTLNGHGKLYNDDGRSSSDDSKKYGTGGLMQGKKYMLSTTWNAPLEAFTEKDQFFEGKSVDDIFIWLHKMYQFLGYSKVDSFNCFDVIKNPNITKDLNDLESHLDKIIKN